MPAIKKPTKKPVSLSQKAKPKIKATAVVKAKNSKSPKNPLAYYECMKACCKIKPKGKKITEIARECKHNALAINTKMSAAKSQAFKKIKVGYETLGQGLGDLLKASQ